MQFKIEKHFIIALLKLPKAKRKTVHRLLQNLDRDINSMGDLIEYVAKDGDTQWMSFLSAGDFDTALTKARKILQDSAVNNIKMVSILDASYPKLLKACDDPPIVLNYVGDIDLLNGKPTIAIIGTRNPSAFGEKYAKHVAGFFAKKGFNVISGLAKGCDTAAHLGCIDSGGATSAILAQGLDIIYPKENAALADRIKDTGLMVSEYFIDTPLAKKNFVDRDRIQAALALGVFIIECDVNSGTMHTANYAVSYNRILTCMKPPLENFEETKVEGNMTLTQTGKAIGLYENSELEELAAALKQLF
jgi:DNA processing protein